MVCYCNLRSGVTQAGHCKQRLFKSSRDVDCCGGPDQNSQLAMGTADVDRSGL